MNSRTRNSNGAYSRKINVQHRLVHQVLEEEQAKMFISVIRENSFDYTGGVIISDKA
jgi:Txe/YoeB family toxin of Txe-Axe toxin-antitoxin module